MQTPQINLLLGWAGISLGFLSGAIIGLFFHREQWLGGYGSFKRRLYRLAHISLFGLGLMNLAFFLTSRALALQGTTAIAASWCFVAGAVSMPICCILMAQFPRILPLFSLPVISLVLGGVLTLSAVLQTERTRHETGVEETQKPGGYEFSRTRL